MTPDLRSQLSATLAGAYTLGRELGGGGMSRVFVADETALGRKVVVKVLHPELAAAVSVERFRREIQLAAQLQHPNIVPVLAAGVAEGLPYYTMPLVDGESLRARLSRGALDAPEAVRILRDVAAALAYSHGRGVVHRDVKPDNVLLARHHALVTDFGVAKALSASAEKARSGMLTTLGVTIGTPAYMAPEQAAADPDADHRADIYALGAMAYEMLSGVPLFGDRSPSALLAAQVAEQPVPLGQRRPGLPPPLVALVMRCLAKDPAARPQSADEVLTELDAVATPGVPGTVATAAYTPAGSVQPPGRTARAARAAAVAAAVVALLGGGYAAARALGLTPSRSLVAEGVLAQRDPLLVADFAAPGRDSSLGTIVSEALRTDLAQSSVVTVAQPAAVRATLLRMQRPPESPLRAELAREVAARDGIKAVVEGEIASLGSGYVLTARLVAPSGNVLAAFRETADDQNELIGAIDRLSHKVRGRAGESLRSLRADPPLDRVTTLSLDALRKYTQGVHALDIDRDVPRAVALLEDAVRIDTGFAMAYRKLGVAFQRTGAEPARQFAMFKKAFDLRDRLPDAERHLATGSYYGLGPYFDAEKALAAYEALLATDPTNTVALNNAALLYDYTRRSDRAAEYLARAVAVDSSSSTYIDNLVGAQINAGRLDDARRSLAAARRVSPNAPGTVMTSAIVATMERDYDAAEALLAPLAGARGGDPLMRAKALQGIALLAVTRGRLADGERAFRESVANDGERGAAGARLLGEMRLAFVDLWFRADTARGVARLDAALRATPIEGLPDRERPYLDFAEAYALGGRVGRARAMLAAYDRTAEMEGMHEKAGRREWAEGAIALAERRWSDAVAAYRAADVGPCVPCALPRLAYAYDRGGQRDSAIAAYERYIATPSSERMFVDALFLAAVHRRLGELYEAGGDDKRAAAHYERFVWLWARADPEVRPQVDAARRRLAQLRDTDAAPPPTRLQ